jgi:flagellin
MNLSGVAPGTYTMTYNRTGGVGSLTAGLGQSIALGTGSSLTGQAITLTGGSGSGVAATVDIDANGFITGLTVTTPSSGYKAGDLLIGTKVSNLSDTFAAGGGSPSTDTFTMQAVNAGDQVNLDGLILTASQNMTAAEVASAFINGTSSLGTFTGARTTATTWNIGAVAGQATQVKLTSVANGAGDPSITATVTKTVNNIVVGQNLTNITGASSTLTMSGTVNGIATTQSLAVSANAALATQKFNFDSFGIAFDVKSYQAQTADQIGASIATLNMGVGQSVAGGPGQVIVASGNNSALKFQSGANSDAYIQIDTVNIQTGNTGQYAGSQLEMTTLGRVITQSGAGNLGTLGLTDTIDTWQTAFKNSAAAVDNALEYISTQRAVYGSQANRLSYINTNLQAQSTNLQNSRSSIIDTDFAAETARLTKGQIMQQAATAMLAQANQMPNVILSLLK